MRFAVHGYNELERGPRRHLQVDGCQVVPGIAILRLLLRRAAERLQRAAEVARLYAAVAERKPALRVERIHRQCQLPVTCRLRR